MHQCRRAHSLTLSHHANLVCVHQEALGIARALLIIELSSLSPRPLSYNNPLLVQPGEVEQLMKRRPFAISMR